jgi:hypothetical protein
MTSLPESQQGGRKSGSLDDPHAGEPKENQELMLAITLFRSPNLGYIVQILLAHDYFK